MAIGWTYGIMSQHESNQQLQNYKTYSICTLERPRTDLRQADVVELAFFDKCCKSFDSVFDRHFIIYPRALKEIKFLCASKFFVDIIDTSPQVFGSKRLLLS